MEILAELSAKLCHKMSEEIAGHADRVTRVADLVKVLSGRVGSLKDGEQALSLRLAASRTADTLRTADDVGAPLLHADAHLDLVEVMSERVGRLEDEMMVLSPRPAGLEAFDTLQLSETADVLSPRADDPVVGVRFPPL